MPNNDRTSQPSHTIIAMEGFSVKAELLKTLMQPASGSPSPSPGTKTPGMPRQAPATSAAKTESSHGTGR